MPLSGEEERQEYLQMKGMEALLASSGLQGPEGSRHPLTDYFALKKYSQINGETSKELQVDKMFLMGA